MIVKAYLLGVHRVYLYIQPFSLLSLPKEDTMKVNTLVVVAAVLALLFGLAFFLIPAQFITIYGLKLEPLGQFMARYFGSALLGVAALNWFARNQVSRVVILADFVLSVAGLVVGFWQAISGLGNSLVWTTVIIYLFLALGFGYYSFLNQESIQLTA